MPGAGAEGRALGCDLVLPGWAYQLVAPERLERVRAAPPAAADLGEGTVVVRLRAAGICGSDLPRFVHPPPHELPAAPGWPLHEVLGEVVASTSPDLAPGQRVAGVADGFRGLREYVTSPASLLYPAPPELPDAEAVLIQPLATVLNAVGRLPDVAGRSVAVLGLGPLGLLFAHAAGRLGAREVVGIDPVDRSEVAGQFGVGELITAPAAEWAAGLDDRRRPDICIEAVGHQTATLDEAIRAAAPGGHVYAFGVPEEERYGISFRTFFRKNLSLYAGGTTDWRRALRRANDWMRRERELVRQLVTHALPMAEAERAFRLASRPEPGRLKVILYTEHGDGIAR